MSNILFDLSEKIDQLTVEVLFIVKSVVDSLKIPFFIVGASARDFILEYGYGIKSPRMTTDIDLGVEIASWEQFNQLTESLVATGKVASAEKRHSFRSGSVLIDILPFGPITDENGRISWPPEHEIFMNMLGFREAYEHSITVRLSSDPEVDIKLPTLSGLALMKIIGWHEKYPERKRDAEDLLFIMHTYEEAGNFERLYEEEQVVLQEENFDTRSASIRLLGRDMGRISDPHTLRTVKKILDNEIGEQSQYKLVTDMIRGTHTFNENFEEVLLQVEKLRKGLGEVEG
jgi:predicted nucleotidyltransferase